MDDAQVRAQLGSPDFGRVAYREGSNQTVPAAELWSYVLGQRASTLTQSDASVTIWFNTDRRLVAVSVYGMPGLAGLDGIGNMKCP